MEKSNDSYKSIEELNIMNGQAQLKIHNHTNDNFEGAEKSLIIEESNAINLNDNNFLPFFDLRLLKLISPDKLDIYSYPDDIREEIAKGSSAWDVFIQLDYEKL